MGRISASCTPLWGGRRGAAYDLYCLGMVQRVQVRLNGGVILEFPPFNN